MQGANSWRHGVGAVLLLVPLLLAACRTPVAVPGPVSAAALTTTSQTTGGRGVTAVNAAPTADTASAASRVGRTSASPVPASRSATSATAAVQLPVGVAALLPAQAAVIAALQAHLRDDQSSQWAVAYRLPGAGSAPYPPPSTHLVILQDAPAGWSVAKSINQGFALGADLQLVSLAGRQAVALQYGTGAHAAGLLVLRYDGALDYAVVYDATSDAGMALRYLTNDGNPEVVRTWSPYCGSFVASPNISIVYAWRRGRFVDATSSFPAVIAGDTAHFQAALTRAGANWAPAGLACLHASLSFLATEADQPAEAAAQLRAAKQADVSYDTGRIARLAAGEPVGAERSAP
jgi:hypothetical protein